MLAAIVIDFLRDPVRKLTPNNPVWITLTAIVVWGCVVLGTSREKGGIWSRPLRLMPRLNATITSIILAVIPGSLLSIGLYEGGYKLIALGGVSYLAPFAGIFVGIHLIKDETGLINLMKVYVIVNGLAMAGVFSEFLGYLIPGTGGLGGEEFFRSMGEGQFLMIVGFHRSPDIMALHAANVVMFSIILLLGERDLFKNSWGPFVVIGLLALFLGGRRKMLLMPLLFWLTYIVLDFTQSQKSLKRFLLLVLPISGAMIAILSMTESNFSTEYIDYASSIFTEGAERVEKSIMGGVLETMVQSGFVGTGIGTATQGGYHFATSAAGWQEDGVSRVLAELGVPGVVMLSFAAYQFFKLIQKSRRDLRLSKRRLSFQALLMGVVVGNLGSYLISHQNFSGDPASSFLVLVFLGAAIGLPFSKKGRKWVIDHGPQRPRGVPYPLYLPDPSLGLKQPSEKSISSDPLPPHSSAARELSH